VEPRPKSFRNKSRIKDPSPNSGAKAEASPSSGVTGSECKIQFPYAFLFEASPSSGAKVEASPNGGATGSDCKGQVPYVFPFGFAQSRAKAGPMPGQR